MQLCLPRTLTLSLLLPGQQKAGWPGPICTLPEHLQLPAGLCCGRGLGHILGHADVSCNEGQVGSTLPAIGGVNRERLHVNHGVQWCYKHLVWEAQNLSQAR